MLKALVTPNGSWHAPSSNCGMKKSLLALLLLLSAFAFTTTGAQAHPYYHHGFYHHHYFYGGRWYDYDDGCAYGPGAFGPGVVIQIVP